MNSRSRLGLCALVGALGLASLAVVSLSGQTPAAPARSTGAKSAPARAAAKPGNAPRTPWGDPDLQGTWFVLYDVPLERSAANANKEFLTDEERAKADEQKGLNPGRNARAAEGTAQDVSGAYNAVFNSVLKTGRRTSMIIDPPDGKIPALAATASAAARAGNRAFPGGGAAGRGAGAG